jgi:GT2 family glycosyltransferase
MNSKINIIIPSIQLSSELIFCLIKLNDQTYKNFFVTIVLDFNNKIKIPKLKYKLRILISGKKNMSFKRNLGAKIFQSNLIAFLDSDAYPNKNWLKIANDYLLKEKNKIIGGPSIPFPRQSYTEMLCHYAKRSFFVTGYLNFRKYKAKSRYCDWLESCNMIMSKNLYLKHGGMNVKKYLGEDKELIARMKKKDNSIKVFFNPELFIYHKERNIKKFLLQRMVFGTDLFNIIKFGNVIKSFQPILPLVVFLFFILVLFYKAESGSNLLFALFFLLSIQLIIFSDVKKYLKGFKKIFLTIGVINLANVAYALGSVLAILNLKNLISRKFYLKSRKNK